MKRLVPALFVVLVVPGVAGAHGLEAECRIEGERATIRAFFDDGTPASEAWIKVIDATGSVVVEGKADDRGIFAFPTPGPGRYKLRVDAGAGHMIELPLQNTGPTRAAFMGYPWFKVGIGLGSIAVFALAFWIARRTTGGHS